MRDGSFNRAQRKAFGELTKKADIIFDETGYRQQLKMVGLEEQQNRIGEMALRAAVELESIGNAAVQKAQAENRRLGIPNWYSING